MHSNTIFYCFLFLFASITPCKQSAYGQTTDLPERNVKVYLGISGGWHEMDDPAGYYKWDYVRRNANGFYTNFIAMWINFYQNKVGAQQSCNDMRKAFVKGECFFETSMEKSVNSGVNGFNNDSTDRRSLNQLTNAGFNVSYTSLNYGYDEQRVQLLRTYKGNRKCFYLAAPWRYGGDIFSNNAATNATVRANILKTDGMQTDGPLGYWFGNQAGMQPGSVSLVKYCVLNKVESAIMLAPYAAGIPGYNSATDFLAVSKHCVFFHEDQLAAPDIWTIWTYGSDANLPNFPESVVNSQGETEAPNTKAGVAYWLLKHLNNFPTVSPSFKNILPTDARVSTPTDSTVELELNKGTEIVIPIEISNSMQPQVELSPVVRAFTTQTNNGFNISFYLNNQNITSTLTANGGLNFIQNLRLTKTNKVVVEMRISIRQENPNPAPTELIIQSMSNISNTVNKKTSYVFRLKKKLQTSIDSNKTVDLRIFPNPTTGSIQINTSENSFNVDIFTVSGLRLLSATAQPTGSTFDLKKIAGSGYYILKINNLFRKVYVI